MRCRKRRDEKNERLAWKSDIFSAALPLPLGFCTPLAHPTRSRFLEHEFYFKCKTLAPEFHSRPQKMYICVTDAVSPKRCRDYYTVSDFSVRLVSHPRLVRIFSRSYFPNTLLHRHYFAFGWRTDERRVGFEKLSLIYILRKVWRRNLVFIILNVARMTFLSSRRFHYSKSRKMERQQSERRTDVTSRVLVYLSLEFSDPTSSMVFKVYPQSLPRDST